LLRDNHVEPFPEVVRHGPGEERNEDPNEHDQQIGDLQFAVSTLGCHQPIAYKSGDARESD
jgi:hypothetical protein